MERLFLAFHELIFDMGLPISKFHWLGTHFFSEVPENKIFDKMCEKLENWYVIL